MHIDKNIILQGQHGKPIVTDICYLKNSVPKPVIIYAHGINGFKDWGNFDIIAKHFASAGFTFIKFNFSHNGTTPEEPEAFADLEAYGNDNYTIQLDDLQTVIDWAWGSENPHTDQIDKDHIYLLGHSKGGGMALLKASEDSRVKKVATWASINVCKTPWGKWPQEKLDQWKEEGVQYLENKRTHQKLPLKYQLYLNYQHNKERLDIEKAVRSLQIPVLFCHGTEDDAIPITEAYKLHKWKPEAELFLVPSDHVFGRKHPWEEATLPIPMNEVLQETIRFFSHKED